MNNFPERELQKTQERRVGRGGVGSADATIEGKPEGEPEDKRQQHCPRYRKAAPQFDATRCLYQRAHCGRDGCPGHRLLREQGEEQERAAGHVLTRYEGKECAANERARERLTGKSYLPDRILQHRGRQGDKSRANERSADAEPKYSPSDRKTNRR